MTDLIDVDDMSDAPVPFTLIEEEWEEGMWSDPLDDWRLSAYESLSLKHKGLIWNVFELCCKLSFFKFQILVLFDLFLNYMFKSENIQMNFFWKENVMCFYKCYFCRFFLV